MAEGDLTFSFTSVLWESTAEASWVFATVPVDDSIEIRELAPSGPGFGSVRVEVRLGDVTWRTSLFPDSKLGAYVLPVKRAVRDQAGVDVGDAAAIELDLLIEGAE